MPQLKDTRETIKLSLKEREGSEIILKDGLLAGDMSFVYGDEATNDVERGLRALSKMIISWNLTDEKDQSLPVTLDNLKRLNLREVEELLIQTSYGKEVKEAKEISDKKKEDLRS